MIRVTAALLHFPDLPIKVGPCHKTDFYSLSTGEPKDLCGPELTVYFSQAQLEDLRDQLLALFPVSLAQQCVDTAYAIGQAKGGAP